jgi:colicin import membrane protein
MALSDHMKQPGLPVSVGLHAAMLVAGLVTFSTPKKLPDAVEAVAVEVIDPSQLNEVTKGEKAPQAQPTPRVDRVDPKPQQNAPGVAQRQVDNDAQPKAQEATAKEERKEQVAVVPPPPVPVRPPTPTPPKPPEPKPVAKPPTPAPSTEEEDEEAEEVIRQAARKKAEEQRKLEQQRQAEERRRQDDERRRVEEQQRRETERRQQQEDARRQAEDKRKQDEQRKLAEEARRKAEEQKKAQQEAARKAEEERKKREGEQAARNQQAIDNARRALLASREAPSNSGNTGQQVQRTPAAGAATATGARLSPSDRAALAGLIADQIRSCWSIPGSGRPSILPSVRVPLNSDGSLAGLHRWPTARAIRFSVRLLIAVCVPSGNVRRSVFLPALPPPMRIGAPLSSI